MGKGLSRGFLGADGGKKSFKLKKKRKKEKTLLSRKMLDTSSVVSCGLLLRIE